MAKAVADVSGQNTGGFSPDGSNITGFSHMHDSGTGGNPSMGQFPLFPQYCPDNVLDNCKFPKLDRAVNPVLDSIVSKPGYFSLDLENGLSAEMTVTQHAALYNFKFPTNTTANGTDLDPIMLLDLTDIYDTRQNATIIIDPTTSRIKGNGTFLPSFGQGSYVLNFCVDFAGAEVLDNGVWVNNRAGSQPKQLFVTRGFNNFYLQSGGWVKFARPANGTITARVGVSWISPDRACSNAEKELASPLTAFNATRMAAETAWRNQFKPISLATSGVNDSLVTNFWSAVYRTMISPQDYTGENPLWSSSKPYFDSYYWYVVTFLWHFTADLVYWKSSSSLLITPNIVSGMSSAPSSLF
jgi:putative alpha-1,2-mannosidase